MLHLALFDTTDLSYEHLRPLLPPEERTRLENKKSDAYRIASAAGRLLAAALFERVFARTAPPITIGAHGAPAFLGETVGLSVSHSDRLVAVAVSDAGERVGVDIESDAFLTTHDDARLTHLRERLAIPTVTHASPLIPYSVATYSEGSLVLSTPLTPSLVHAADTSFLTDYTALEACIKADGRGFLALSEVDAFYKNASFFIGRLTDRTGDFYTLSIAVL